MKAERDALQENVFPRLSDLCDDFGFDFQPIDLRWGVTEEAAHAQDTMQICISEIQRCQQMCPRPNFLVLLGDRYGWRPLPNEIPAEEFSSILTSLRRDNPSAAELASQWYRLDSNCLSGAVYVLQSLAATHLDWGTWHREIERPLQGALARTATRIGLPANTKEKYVASATSIEIDHGVFKVSDASEHVLCFCRNISTLPVGLFDEPALRSQATQFFDVTGEGELDEDAQKCLLDLKARLRKALPHSLHEYSATLTRAGITTNHIGEIPSDLDACVQLLFDPLSPDTLCCQVWKRLAVKLLLEISKHNQGNPLLTEVDYHEQVAERMRTSILGRRRELGLIEDYLHNSDRRPLVVFGSTGCGKTTLMSEAYAKAKRMSDATTVARFVGASPRSTRSEKLILDLAGEVCLKRGAGESVPGQVFATFESELARQLQLHSQSGRLVVFLDSYDKLDPTPPHCSSGQLPEELPPNTKLIVSVTCGVPNTAVDAIGNELPWTNSLHVGDLDVSERRSFVADALQRLNRTLTEDQWSAVDAYVFSSGAPFYLTMLAERCASWASYDIGHHQGFPSTIDGAIKMIVKELTTRFHHDPLLIDRCFGYICTSFGRISERRLLDVLVTDAEFFEHFIKHAKHGLPNQDARGRRLPFAVWGRLRNDAKALLLDIGTSIGLSNEHVRRVVQAMFLAGRAEARAHQHIGRYLSESDNPGAAFQHYQKLASLLPGDESAAVGMDNALSHVNRTIRDRLATNTDVQAYSEFVRGYVAASGEGLVSSAGMPDPKEFSMNLDAVRLCNEGHLLFEQGRHQDALTKYDQALALNPKYCRALSNKGTALASLGRLDEALKCYALALKVNPTDAESLYNAGWSLAQCQQHSEALTYFDASIASYTRTGDTFGIDRSINMKAHSLVSLGQLQAAAEMWEKAVELTLHEERRIHYWFNIAGVAAQTGNQELAIEYYDKVLAMRPDDREAWNNKGVMLHELGRRKEAEICLQRAKPRSWIMGLFRRLAGIRD